MLQSCRLVGSFQLTPHPPPSWLFPGVPGPGMWLPVGGSPAPLGYCSPLWTPYKDRDPL